MLLDTRTLLRGAAMLGAGVFIAVILAALPADPRDDGARDLGSLLPGEAVGEAGSTQDGGLLTGRADIWRGALELAVTWERVPSDTSVMQFLRPLFGFGPEMYYYSHPLAAPPQRVLEIASHTHNYPLQILMELGYAGLLAFFALVAFAVLAAARLFKAARSNARGAHWGAIVLVGVIAALAGRAFEQMAGVARLGDLAPYWALLALLVALTGIARGAPAYVYSGPIRKRPLSHMTNRQTAAVFAATMMAVLAVALFTIFDFRALRGSRAAVQAERALARGQTETAVDLYIRAGELAPLAERYPVNAATLLLRAAADEEDNTRRLELAERSHGVLVDYASRNPYAYSALLRLASNRTFIATRGGAVGAAELLPTLERIVDALPSYPAIIAFVANEYAAVGLLDRAYQVAQLAISMEDVDARRVVPQAWWTVGEVHAQRGDTAAAQVALETAIERDPEGQFAALAHRSLARLLDGQGLGDQATEHRIKADAIEDGLTRS
jgi:tetratricopeptide (TPR) repeat protein